MRQRPMKTLNEIFDGWYDGGGIFSLLRSADDNELPWIGTDMLGLDFDYHGNHSGDKYISVVVDKLGEKITDPIELRKALCKMLLSRYRQRWQKLYDTLNQEYAMIDNYNMVENGTDTTAGTRTPNLTDISKRVPDLTYDDKGSETPDLTETDVTITTPGKTTKTTSKREPNITNTQIITDDNTQTDDYKWAFNQGVGKSPTQSQTITKGSNETSKETGTEDNTESVVESGKETVDVTHITQGSKGIKNTRTETGSDETTETHTGTEKNDEHVVHHLERKGNIGVTTSQQMIQSERDLWMWDYWQTVMRDIDNCLVLKIY